MTTQLVGPFGPTRLPHRQAIDLADLLKALASPARLQILDLLQKAGDDGLAGVRVAEQLGYLGQPTVSHHLTILVRAGLVRRSADPRSRPGVPITHWLNRARMSELATVLIPGGTR